MTLGVSLPSRRRRRKAVSLFLGVGVAGSLARLSRPDFGLLPALAPLDVHGAAPNFAVCAGAPLLAFCSRDAIDLRNYAKTAAATAAGLSVYEVAQLYLPRRTFDLWDVAASFLGAAFSVALASVLFLRRPSGARTAEPGATPDGGPAEPAAAAGRFTQ